jgi:hypothetical protein
MDIEFTVNHEISSAGEVYEANREGERIGRIWQRRASIDPANKWVWSLLSLPGRALRAADLPSGTAATLEDAKAQFEAAVLRLGGGQTAAESR